MKTFLLAAAATIGLSGAAFAMEPATMDNRGPNAGSAGYATTAPQAGVTPAYEDIDMGTTASIPREDVPRTAAEAANEPALEYGPTVDRFDIYTGK